MRKLLLLLALTSALMADSPLGSISGANFNSTGDQSITITIPMGCTQYVITSIIAYGASAPLTTAAGGIYTSTSKGGSAVVPAGQTYGTLTGSTIFMPLLIGSAVRNMPFNATTLYLSLTTPQGGAATANVAVFGNCLP